MTDHNREEREGLIEKAAKAIYETSIDLKFEDADGWNRELAKQEAQAALAVFEQAHAPSNEMEGSNHASSDCVCRMGGSVEGERVAVTDAADPRASQGDDEAQAGRGAVASTPTSDERGALSKGLSDIGAIRKQWASDREYTLWVNAPLEVVLDEADRSRRPEVAYAPSEQVMAAAEKIASENSELMDRLAQAEPKVRHTFDSDDCVTNECDCAQAEPTDEQVRAAWDALGPGITIAFEYEELRAALSAAFKAGGN